MATSQAKRVATRTSAERAVGYRPRAKARRASAKTKKNAEGAVEGLLKNLPLELRRVAFEEGAQEAARVVSADIVRNALQQGGKSLRQIQEETGLDKAMISRIATGHHKTGPHVWSLMAIARALGLNLKITLE